MINMDNEKQYKALLESYQKAYPDVFKQNKFKVAQREWIRVKNSPDGYYEKFLLTVQAKTAKPKAATISWWTQLKKEGK